MRRAYLALVWRPGDPNSEAHASALCGRLAADQAWRCGAMTDQLAIWVSADAPLPVVRIGCDRGFIVGHLYPAAMAALDLGSKAPRNDPLGGARRLARNRWGGFVALLQNGPTAPTAIYREPSGALGCATWSLGDHVLVVASDITVAPAGIRPRHGFLNWDRIGAFLAVPSAATTPSLFDDVTAVGPGQALVLGGRHPPEMVWDPTTFADPVHVDLPAVKEEFVRRVDTATAWLVGQHDRVIMELSGGLDSSILAGAIGATGLTGRVSHWLNYRDGRPEGDETRFARAVTDRLGVPLTSQAAVLTPVDDAALKALGSYACPAIGGVDCGRDTFEASMVQGAAATGIVSGQGGDAVFFQFPSALVAADELARRGWRGLMSPVLRDVARRTRQSVWAVLGQVDAARRGRAKRPLIQSTLLTPWLAEAAAGIEHEWVTAARRAGLPPGKVAHVQGIALPHIYRGPSRRLQHADLLMPLFTQPVMELGLSVPVPDLAGGSFDRPFARAAFAERLPEAVINRRAKGNLSAHVARMVAISCDVLRPYLLDGCLCEAGLLDRTTLERTLNPEALMLGTAGSPDDVLTAAAVEAWVRHWQTLVPDSLKAQRFRGDR